MAPPRHGRGEDELKCIAPKPAHTRSDWKARHTFPGTPKHVGEARTWVKSTLAKWGVAEPDQLTLVVSELVTNAITHTRSGHPGEQFTVRLAVLGDRVRITVRDAGPKQGRTLTLRTPSPEAKHGRGLPLVDALALCWGSLKIGTGVYAEVAR
ncbi:ATP-binding protein [Nocardiopsis exhalans]|uniref:ATP-binding protein n=1 Tax=Nocardiopsis exhalans TaxID=163604 RepID=UPI00263AC4A8|nr:ATP-binding protein [Nocardiopsis exhalans]